MSSISGPARSGDVYRFDRRSKDPYGRDLMEQFCVDATDESGARWEAEYLLNPEHAGQSRDLTGTLWRVDGSQDVHVADIGPLDFGRAR